MPSIFSVSQLDELKLGPLASGVNTARYDSSAQYTLGEIAFGKDGKKYRYVKFVDAVAYAAGHVVTLASATTWDVTNDRAGGSALANHPVVGVALGVPTQNQYGWVQIAGIATVLIEGAAVIAGDILVADPTNDGAASEADYTAVAHADFLRVGQAMATIADGATGLVLLQIPSAA